MGGAPTLIGSQFGGADRSVSRAIPLMDAMGAIGGIPARGLDSPARPLEPRARAGVGPMGSGDGSADLGCASHFPLYVRACIFVAPGPHSGHQKQRKQAWGGVPLRLT